MAGGDIGGFQHLFKNRQDACSTISQFSCGTGILPVPDTAGGDIGGFQHLFKNRQDACSTISQFSCGTGILPVPDTGAKSISPQSIHPAIPRANPHNSVPNYRRRLK